MIIPNKSGLILGGLLVAALLVVYYLGKSNGSLRNQVSTLQHTADSLKHNIAHTDTIVQTRKDTVVVTKIRLKVIDNTTKPKIDSAVSQLSRTLGDSDNIKLKVILTSYESRIQIRDKLIADQQAVIAVQDSAIAQRDRLIIVYEKEVKKLKHLNTLKTITSVAAGIAGFIIGRVL